MTSTNQNTNKPEASDKAVKFNAKIKETWSKLSDDDIKLYASNRDQFFAKLKEKQNLSKDDGDKIITEIEKSLAAACGIEKTGAVKAA